jgi:hypothetical protein
MSAPASTSTDLFDQLPFDQKAQSPSVPPSTCADGRFNPLAALRLHLAVQIHRTSDSEVVKVCVQKTPRSAPSVVA